MPHILQRIVFEGVEDGGEVAFAGIGQEDDHPLALVFGAKGDLRGGIEGCSGGDTDQQFILTKLGEIDSVASIESTFVMSEIKQNYGINF